MAEEAAPGFLSGLMDGFVSTVAPNYFQYMVKQRDAMAHQQSTQAALKQLADQASSLYDPMLNDPKTSPAKKHVLRQLKAMAISGNVLLAEKYPDMVENTQKAILEADKPSSLRSDMEYAAELDPYTYTPQKIAEGIYQTHTKPNTQINFGDKPLPPSELVDEQGNRVPQPVGATTNEIVRAHGGKVYYAPKESKGTGKNRLNSTDSNTMAAFESSKASIAKIKQLRKEGVDVSGVLGMIQDARSQGNIIGNVVDYASNALGINLSPKEAEMLSEVSKLSTQGIKFITGTGAGEKEREDIKKSFPGSGQNITSFDTNLDVTNRYLDNYKESFLKNIGASDSIKNSSGKDTSNYNSEPNIIKSEVIGGKTIHYDDQGNPYIEE